MPRKKQGLRSYHHKTRNGCMQCKRRRVKCNLQSPVCGNCVRRNEICEYPTFSESTSPPDVSQESNELTIAGSTSVSFEEFVLPSSLPTSFPRTFDHPLYASWSLPPAFPLTVSETIEVNTSPQNIREVLSILFAHSWFSPREAALWVPALSRLAIKYPYLQHCILAVINLRQDAQFHQLDGAPTASAYQHHLTASSLFRQAYPTIDENNWLAVLAFSTFMLIFQFYTQTTCDEEHFDLIETLRVVRSTTALNRAASPYFHQSSFWAMIVSRTTITNPEPDPKLRNAFQLLASVISESIGNEDNNDDDEETAEINRHAFWELREWIPICGGQPRRWDQYCHWPSKVRPEFLELLADGNDVALLVLIHWTAIMHRSQKPFIRAWSKRVAFYAINRLQGAWGDVLVWPLAVFAPQPSASISTFHQNPVQLQLPSSSGPMNVELFQSSTATTSEYMPSLTEDMDNLAPYVHTTME